MEWITRITASATFSTFTVFQGGYVYEYQFRPHHSGVNTGTDDPTTVLGKERKKLFFILVRNMMNNCEKYPNILN